MPNPFLPPGFDESELDIPDEYKGESQYEFEAMKILHKAVIDVSELDAKAREKGVKMALYRVIELIDKKQQDLGYNVYSGEITDKNAPGYNQALRDLKKEIVRMVLLYK